MTTANHKITATNLRRRYYPKASNGDEPIETHTDLNRVATQVRSDVKRGGLCALFTGGVVALVIYLAGVLS